RRWESCRLPWPWPACFVRYDTLLLPSVSTLGKGRRGMHNVWSREGYWYKYLHPHFSTCHLLLTKLVNW
ncbi:unnamed protein product, partial [Sphagnum troendelagicum]